MCDWISVETELPIIDELVDVIVDDKEAQYNLTRGRFTDVRYGEDGRFYSWQFGFLVDNVTHWMYPPKLYKMDRDLIEKSEYDKESKILKIYFKDGAVNKYIGTCTVWLYFDSFVRCDSHTESILWEQWYKCKYMDAQKNK